MEIDELAWYNNRLLLYHASSGNVRDLHLLGLLSHFWGSDSAGFRPYHFHRSRPILCYRCATHGRARTNRNGGSQCFPFYTYDGHGSNRRENITDWALSDFRTHYSDSTITKWDIFHYVYAVLHHPEYRKRYAVKLKRELPRIPYLEDFRSLAEAGRKLSDLHVNYEQQPEYPLERVEKGQLDWRVEKMCLSKDKTTLVYNEFLTLKGIPPETYQHRLGNRSALDWVIDQYQIATDKRSGITNDPNRADDPEYIVRLIGQVVTVSLETMKIVKELPELVIDENLQVEHVQ